MKPPALTAAILLAALSACNASSGDSRAPDSASTLAPGGAFRDGLLYAAVKARLAGADIDSATRISVAVHGGEVTLSGNVADAQTKDRDVKLVREMHGVKGLNDLLRVGHTGPSTAQTIRDAALVTAVAGALTAQTGVNVAAIKIRADDGTVILAGRAPTSAIKSTMVDAAKKTPGVRNVVDRIAVK